MLLDIAYNVINIACASQHRIAIVVRVAFIQRIE